MQLRWLLQLIFAMCVLNAPAAAGEGDGCGHTRIESHGSTPHVHAHTHQGMDTSHDHDEVTLCAPESDHCHQHCCASHHDAPSFISQGQTQQRDDTQQPAVPQWRTLDSMQPRAPPSEVRLTALPIPLRVQLQQICTIVLLN